MNEVLSAPSRLPLLLILLLVPGVGLAAPESVHPPLARHSALSEPLSEPRMASSGLPGTDARAPLRLREDDWAQAEKEDPALTAPCASWWRREPAC
ncbi:hypothetical protein F0U59_48665 [Archangium gephyra]|nr:hypothetical protein F0U59_48665 [Archangium gephyra]